MARSSIGVSRRGHRTLCGYRKSAIACGKGVIAYRILLFFEGEPQGEVLSIAPLVAIEILSPDDRIGYIVPKLEDYRQWGVRNIWIADPEDRKLFTYGETGLHEVKELGLPEYDIMLTYADIFGAA